VTSPRRVAFTDHAAERAARYALPAVEVADVVLAEHPRPHGNPGAAEWRVRRGTLVVLYDWPDGDDETTARVVTVWRAG
jgi:hypothetical protein